MRNPILHDLFNVANKNGLSNLLESSTMDILDCVKNTRIENLQIITSGASSHDQSDQLLSERISEILDHLKGHTDLIIMDSPPALLAADAIILSTRADGVITVARVGKSRRKAIRQLLKDLQEVNANVLGCICNEIKNGNGLAVSKQNKPRKKLSYRPRSLSTYLTGLRTATRQFGAVFIKLLKHNNN